MPDEQQCLDYFDAVRKVAHPLAPLAERVLLVAEVRVVFEGTALKAPSTRHVGMQAGHPEVPGCEEAAVDEEA